jgi:hypothetical protein
VQSIDIEKYLGSRTADSVRRQAQRELEQEKALTNEYQQALDLKEHYFSNRQVHFVFFFFYCFVLMFSFTDQYGKFIGS